MARKRTELNVSGGVGVPPRRVSQRRARHAAPPEANPAVVVDMPVEFTPAGEPSYAEIAQLAYSYWELRGCEGGSSEEDWLRAEQELRSRAKTAGA